MAFKPIFREIALLSVAAIALAFIVNAISPRGIPLFGRWDVKAGRITAKPAPEAKQSWGEIEIGEAATLYNQGILFVDARSAADYAKGHIKGARSLPVEIFYEKIKAFKEEYPDTMAILTYCSGRECTDSHDLAENLIQSGYTNVRTFIDGYPLWESQGLPVEK
jgi:rhodanese-related sulfurtransferase